MRIMVESRAAVLVPALLLANTVESKLGSFWSLGQKMFQQDSIRLLQSNDTFNNMTNGTNMTDAATYSPSQVGQSTVPTLAPTFFNNMTNSTNSTNVTAAPSQSTGPTLAPSLFNNMTNSTNFTNSTNVTAAPSQSTGPTLAPTLFNNMTNMTNVTAAPTQIGQTAVPTSTPTLFNNMTNMTNMTNSTNGPTVSPVHMELTAIPTETPTPAPTRPPFPPGSCPTTMLEPPVPGITPGTNGRPRIVLAAMPGEPPYVELGSPEDGFPLSGFVVKVGQSLSQVCDIDISFSEAAPGTCFTTFGIADRLAQGAVHGCANYLHTVGPRDRQAEFTLPLADNRTPAGLLTRLEANGEPALSGLDNLDDKIIVDVPGSVPNPEDLLNAVNPCTGQPFGKPTIVSSDLPGFAADSALQYLLNGKADGLWINAALPYTYQCANLKNGTTPNYNCTLWDGLGSTYAFVQTGIPSTAISGTTLAMSKKGAGLAAILNPCIEAFLQTEEYFNLCTEADLVANGVCFPNEFFPVAMLPPTDPEWSIPTNGLNSTCAEGYCACPLNATRF